MVAILDQLTGGHAISWSSIEFICGPLHLSLLGALNYEHRVEQGELRGTGPFVVSTTRGTYSASGSLTLYIEEAQTLRQALMALPGGGLGYLEKKFTAVVTYAEPLSGKTMIDTLEGVRLLSERNNYSPGADALMVEFDLFIRKVNKGGLPAVTDNTGKPF